MSVSYHQRMTTADDRLLNILMAKLTGEEQQHFITGFSQFLDNNPSTDFVVDFEFTYEWLGFAQKGHAKRKMESSLIEGVDFKVLLSQSGKQVGNTNSTSDLLSRSKEQVGNVNADGRNLGGAGLNKETIFLTVNGFKAFCMLAGTEKAKRVRQYYIAIENVLFEYTKAVMNDVEFGKSYSRHQALVTSNENINVLYIGCVVINGVPHLKLGETLDIHTRGSMLRTEYGHTFVFIEVYPCERAHPYEQWLLKNSELSKYRCTVDIEGESKTELLRLTEGGLTKERTVKVVRDNLHLFCGKDVANERLHLVSVLTTQGISMDDIKQIIATPPHAPLVSPAEETMIKGLNDNTQAIQRYTVDGALMSVFDSIREAARRVPGTSAYSITTAANENYLYKGTRWLMADTETRYDVQTLPPQNNSNAHINGNSTIAQIDPETNKILQTFANLELASAAVGLRSAATLTLAIQNTRKSKGFMWKRFDDCESEAKTAFVAAGGAVIAPLARTGKKINQLDPVTGVIIKTFATIQEACLAHHASHKSFHKAAAANEVYKKFKWQLEVVV